jgi:hypothetical protein
VPTLELNSKKEWERDLYNVNLLKLYVQNTDENENDGNAHSDKKEAEEEEEEFYDASFTHTTSTGFVKNNQKHTVTTTTTMGYIRYITKRVNYYSVRSLIWLLDQPKHVVEIIVKWAYVHWMVQYYVITMRYAGYNTLVESTEVSNTPLDILGYYDSSIPYISRFDAATATTEISVDPNTVLIWYANSVVARDIRTGLLGCFYLVTLWQIFNVGRAILNRYKRTLRDDNWRSAASPNRRRQSVLIYLSKAVSFISRKKKD